MSSKITHNRHTENMNMCTTMYMYICTYSLIVYESSYCLSFWIISLCIHCSLSPKWMPYFKGFGIIAEVFYPLEGYSWQHLLEHLFRAHSSSKSHSCGKWFQAVFLSGRFPAKNSEKSLAFNCKALVSW
jgi:hypothetical protein